MKSFIRSTACAVAAFLILYVVLSACISIVYAVHPDPWSVAEHRHGLLIVSVQPWAEWRPEGRTGTEIWILNPFTTYGDDWIIGIGPGLGVRFCY